MSLALNEDQTMLAQTANAFAEEHCTVQRLRKLRDTRDERGYSLDVYRQMAELGWTAIPFTEADGGLDMGLAETVLVTEAMGRGLSPEPLVSSAVLAGHVLARAGTSAQKEAWLSPAIAGDKVLALAHTERGSRYDLSRVALRAEPSGRGYELTGEKHGVLHGHLADAVIVAARNAGEPGQAEGITLLLVPAGTAGLTSVRQWRVDSLNAAILRFDGVQVGEDAVVGEVGKGHALLAEAVDRATVALCGEMLGGMAEAFDRTLSYLKERKQFDQVIGSFQALKHRAAKMYIERELARSAVMAAARAVDAGDPDAASLVSIAKARCSDAYVLIANEAVQMFGGIGMTDEHEIGFFMKRARASELTYGDSAFHRDRYATLNGY